MVGLLIAAFIIGSVLSSPIVNAKKYQQLLTVDTREFTEDIKQVSFDKIPLLDSESAAIIGNRKMGSMVDYASQFEVSDTYTQINFNDVPVRVAPLRYASPIKWLTNQSDGIPAYMKIDMAGSAVVLSLIKLLAMRKAKVNAIGVMALVENMPSGHATKVGDIVKSMSGQTIEITNTDAEGRVILADALYYTATKYEPELIIDLATLTGAIMVALGDDYAGLFTNNSELFKQLKEAGENTEEKVWRMPLSEIGGFYDKQMDSDFADIKNAEKGRYGASITAAQFLQRFINKHPKWAHIDIASTAYVAKEHYLTPKNATGYGVRLLNELVKKNYEK